MLSIYTSAQVHVDELKVKKKKSFSNLRIPTISAPVMANGNYYFYQVIKLLWSYHRQGVDVGCRDDGCHLGQDLCCGLHWGGFWGDQL